MKNYNMLVNCKDTNRKFFAYESNGFVSVSNGINYKKPFFEKKFDTVKMYDESNYNLLVSAYRSIQISKGARGKDRTHIFVSNPVNHCRILVRLDDERFKDQIITEINEKLKGQNDYLQI